MERICVKCGCEIIDGHYCQEAERADLELMVRSLQMIPRPPGLDLFCFDDVATPELEDFIKGSG